MEIQHTDSDDKGFFKAIENGNEAGIMTYSWASHARLVINHIEVNPVYSGKGAGKKLVMAAVEYARENDIKIVPLCPFAKSIFEKMPEVRDVL